MPKWTRTELLSVSLAIAKDQAKGWIGNTNVFCPVCKTNSLDYHRSSILDMTGWCRKCKQGIEQGNGSNLLHKES